MFFVVRPNIPPSHDFPHRRHGRVKHRFGRRHRFHPFYPFLSADSDDEEYFARWAPRRRCASKCAKSDESMADDKNENTTPATQQDSNNEVKEKETENSSKKILKAPEKLEKKASGDGTLNSRHQTSDENTVVERTPVHRQETEDAATISLDVSGFSVDQLQVRLEEDTTIPGRLARPILIVSGERTNALGDTFKIHRRFLLERENLADDLQDVAISANFSKEGILTIQVPKKKKEAEKELSKVSRTIQVQTQPLPSEDKPKETQNDQDMETNA